MGKNYYRDRDREKMPSHYSLSVIVPAYNEVDNIEPLVLEFDKFLSQQHFRSEVIVVDDGSTDGTGDRVLELSGRFDFLKLVRHKQNMGKTAAIETGFAVSNGKRIAIFDADLQYDPQDLKRMMDKLDRGYGIVSGIKQGKYQKPFVSKIFNGLTRRLFGIKVKDMNSLKILRREVMAELFLRKDWHRFMVVLAAERGYRVADIPVKLRPRRFGKPKYGGFGRVFVGITDLIAVWLSERVFRKPMLYFGSIGLVSLMISVLLALFIFIARLGFDRGYPPLQTILILAISISGFSFTLGFLAEAIANLRDRIEFLMSKEAKIETPVIEVAPKNYTRRTEYKSESSRRDDTRQNRSTSGRTSTDRPKPSSDTDKTKRRDDRPSPRQQDDRPPQKKRDDRPSPRQQDDRPPQKNRDDRPPPRQQEDRPPQKNRDDRPSPRQQDDRPPQKKRDDRPPPRQQEDRPPPKMRDNRPPPRQQEDRPPQKKRDDRPPPRQQEDRPPPKKRDDRPPPRQQEDRPSPRLEKDRPPPKMKEEPPPPKKEDDLQKKPTKPKEPENIIDSFEVEQKEESWGRHGWKKHTNVVNVADSEESMKKAMELAKDIDRDSVTEFKKEGETEDET